MNGNISRTRICPGRISNESHFLADDSLLNTNTHQINYNHAHSQANYVPLGNRTNLLICKGNTPVPMPMLSQVITVPTLQICFLRITVLTVSYKMGISMLIPPHVTSIPSIHQCKISTEMQICR